MPKLPEALGTPQDLGAVPPDPSRLIPHYQAGQVGAAMQGLGGDMAQAAGELQQAHDKQAAAEGLNQFLDKKLELDQAAQSDPNYAGAAQRYGQSLQQAAQQASAGISNPGARAEFQMQLKSIMNAGQSAVARMARGKEIDAGRANLQQTYDQGIDNAVRLEGAQNRIDTLWTVTGAIDAAATQGYIAPVEAQQMRRRLPQDFATRYANSLPPGDRLKFLSGAQGTPEDQLLQHIPDADRSAMLSRAQQDLALNERAAGIEALRQQRRQQQAETDAASAIAARYVDALAADPTSVDVGALAREDFPESQRPMRQALMGATESVLAQGAGRDASYGPGFWSAFNHVTAPASDPAAIRDPVELLRLAGPEGGGALTIQGVRELQRYLDANASPESRAQSAMEQMFLRQAHAAIAGTQDVADPAAEARFQNFLGAYFPALKAGLAAGKSPTQLLSAASADYLGTLIPAFTPPAAPAAADQPGQNAPAAPAADQLDAAASSGRRDKDTGTLTDDRSHWQHFLDGFAAVATGMTEEQQAARQGVNPGLTRDLARRLGTLDLSQDVPMVAPDDRGILEKPEVFAPWRMVALGRDVYERVPEAEENRLAGVGRVVAPGIIETPVGAAKLRGATAAAKAADAEASGARTAEAADQAAPGERAVPSAEARRGPPLSSLSKAQVEALRPTVLLPQYDGQTSAILFTNEGRIIEFKSGAPDLRFSLPATKHAEGKAAIWIRDNNSSGGVVFHNNPDGTCGICNSNLPTLLPEGTRLWVVPRADAMAKDPTWIDYAKPYDGNSAQPQPPNPK